MSDRLVAATKDRFGLVNVGTLRNRANHGTTGKKNQDRCDNWAGE
jgi:hypothetical protein